jgi:hypothetical protein
MVRLCELCRKTVFNRLSARVHSIVDTFPNEESSLWSLHDRFVETSTTDDYAHLNTAIGPLETKIETLERREAYRYHSSLRRARLQASESEPYRRGEVFNRDDGICQLCSKPVDRLAVYPDPMSMSVDHVIPISWGGSDTLSNVQLAHLVCNLKKGNRHL